MFKKFAPVLLAAAALTGPATADAAVFIATNGSAPADITATPNGGNTDVTIVLTNTTATPSTTSAGNLLTGLNFGGALDINTFTLLTQTGAQQFVFGTPTTGGLSGGGPFDPSFAMVSGKGLYFDGFGSGGKPIIGPAVTNTTYAGANASLTAGPHGTYIYQTATFTLSAPGVFNPDALTTVNFLFNTDGSIVVPGDPGGGGGIPEPASLAVLSLGAVALLKRRK